LRLENGAPGYYVRRPFQVEQRRLVADTYDAAGRSCAFAALGNRTELRPEGSKRNIGLSISFLDRCKLLEVHMADNNGAGVGMGLIAGLLLLMLLGVGFLFATGRINLDGGKDVNVNVELPKAPPMGGDTKPN
jgi:hypothetical protein